MPIIFVRLEKFYIKTKQKDTSEFFKEYYFAFNNNSFYLVSYADF